MSPTSVHHVFLISLTATAGLIAVWAALSRRHALLRLAVFCALPAAIWWAPAPELVSHLVLQMVVISTLVIGLRFIAEAPHGRSFAKLPKLQFGLTRLFYATFLAALLAAAVSVLGHQVAGRSPTLVLHWFVQQTSLALPIVGAAWFARREGSRKKRAVVLLGACLAGSLGLCALPSRSDETFSTFDAWGIDIDWQYIEIDWWYVGLVPLLLGVVTAGILWKARGSLGQPAAGVAWRARLPGAVASLMMAAFVALPACYMYYELVREIPTPQVDIPSPNGYERLGDIGEQLANSVITQQQRYELIQEARQSVTMPSVVPLNYAVPRQVPYLRVIARELNATADAEYQLGNFDVALAIYLDVLTLADRAQRGGIGIDMSMGSEIETASLRSLAGLVPKLSTSQCGAAVKQLLAYDDGREPIADVQRRDDLYEVLSHGWRGRWRATVDAVHHSFFDHRVNDQFDRQRRRDQAWLRVVVCDLAIRAFRLERRRLPASLSELVPNYLPRVPFDPQLKGPKYTKLAADQYKVSALDLLDEIFCTIERKEGVNMGSPQ